MWLITKTLRKRQKKPQTTEQGTYTEHFQKKYLNERFIAEAHGNA